MVTYRNRDPEPSVRFRPPHPVLKVLAVLFCCIQLLVVPAFAYTSESFVVDTDPYLFKSLQAEAPALMSLDSGVSLAALSTDYEVEIFNYFASGSYPESVTVATHSVRPPISAGGLDLPAVPVWDTVDSAFSSSGVYNTNSLIFYYNSVVIPSYDSDEDNFAFISIPDFATTFRFSLDLSSLGSFDSFDLNGRFACRLQAYPGFTSNSKSASKCILFVNGVEVKTFVGPVFDSAGFLYTGTSDITDITFEFYFSQNDLLVIDDESLVGTSISPRLVLSNVDDFSMSVLGPNAVLDGANSNAQSDLNDFNSIEQQYQSNMQQNWESLQLSNFQFSDTFDSSFALISGIFSDLWLAIGDFNMIYMIPLTIGLVSVVIGRTSKSRSGSSGSPVSDSTDLVVRR